MSEEQSDVDFDYAVLDWLKLSMEKVASNPKSLADFLYAYTEKLPEILDAFMGVTPVEHRGAVAEVVTSSGKMSGALLRLITSRLRK